MFSNETFTVQILLTDYQIIKKNEKEKKISAIFKSFASLTPKSLTHLLFLYNDWHSVIAREWLVHD